MSTIFVSYATPDRDAAQRLASALESKGWSVWWDRSILPGLAFDRAINDAIRDSACMVVLWSGASIQSNWVLEEATDGRDRGMLVPALIERVEPPRGFRRFQALDLTGWNGDIGAPEFELLCAGIQRVMQTQSPPGSQNTRPSDRSTPLQSAGRTPGSLLPRDVRTDYLRLWFGSQGICEFVLADHHSLVYRRRDMFCVQAVSFYLDDRLIARRWMIPTEEWEQYFEIESTECCIRCRFSFIKIDVRVEVAGRQVLHL